MVRHEEPNMDTDMGVHLAERVMQTVLWYYALVCWYSNISTPSYVSICVEEKHNGPGSALAEFLRTELVIRRSVLTF